jgi:hypothetical protein
VSEHPEPRDLILLVADRDQEATMRSLLQRPQALGIKKVSFDVRVHPRRDPGCRLEAHEFLRPFARQYRHALVIFDHAGCGREELTATELEGEVCAGIRPIWEDRAAVVVVDPEIEIWIWSQSPHVARAVGWEKKQPPLRQWLRERGLWGDAPKPPDPKAAMEAALREVRRPRSSSIFGEIAGRASVEGCSDLSFGRCRQVLDGWFRAGTGSG